MAEFETLKTPPIVYDARDFESIRDEMIRTIPFFTPEWTSTRPSDLGIVLVELLAMGLDVLHFYVDRAFLEAFPHTAIKKESFVGMSKIIDFLIPGPSAASADVVFTLATPHPGPGNLVIPAGLSMSTGGEAPVSFELAADVIISPGASTGQGTVVQGDTEFVDFISTGTEGQTFEVEFPAIDGSEKVEVNEGPGFIEWLKVDTLAFSEPTDDVFEISRDDDDFLTILFGDNSNGRIPPAGATIRVTVRVGVGADGNVGENTITNINDPVLFLGNPVTVTATNPAKASGGAASPGIEELRKLLPRSVRTLERAVTLEDYQNLVEAIPGVGAARAFTTIPEQSVGCCCGIRVVVAADGGGPASALLKQQILDELNNKKIVGTCVEIGDADEVLIDVTGTVNVLRGFVLSEVQSEVEQKVDDIFRFGAETVGFGQALFLSDVFRIIDDTPGVSFVDLDKVTRRPVATLVLWSGDPTFSAIEPSALAIDETWTVTWVSATQFSVKGSISGLQASQGTIDVPYTSNDLKVSFTLLSGTTPPQAGDNATFRTSARVGNVPIDPLEIGTKGTVNLTFVFEPLPSAGTC